MLRVMLQRAMTGMKRRSKPDGEGGADGGGEEAVGPVGQSEGAAVPNGLGVGGGEEVRVGNLFRVMQIRV